MPASESGLRQESSLSLGFWCPPSCSWSQSEGDREMWSGEGDQPWPGDHTGALDLAMSDAELSCSFQ